MFDILFILLIVLIAIALYVFIAVKRVQLMFKKQEKQKLSPAKLAVIILYICVIGFVALQIFSKGPIEFSQEISAMAPGLLSTISNFVNENFIVLVALVVLIYATVFGLKILKAKKAVENPKT